MTATPQTGRHEFPDGHQDDRADQRSQNGDPIHVDVTNPIDDDDLGEQPGANQRRDDGSDETEGQPPANKGFGDEADDRRNDQVNDKVDPEGPDIVTQFDGDPIGQDKR
jgi:hypothetical protein